MIPESYLRRIRQIDVKSRHLADELFAGEYHSVFKGRGMDFEEVREYSDGDDARQIHWNATARTGVPYVKLFREERELSFHLLIDVSASGELASGPQSKRELAAELAACLAYTALRNRDRVGLLLFSSHVEHRVPAAKGRNHVLRLIRDILYTEPAHSGTSLRNALEIFHQVQARRSVLVIISDFLDEGYARALRIVARKHDVIPIVVEDLRERELPAAGWVALEDAETGEIIEVDTSSPPLRAAYAAGQVHRRVERNALFKSAGLVPVELCTNAPYVEALQRFFNWRVRMAG